jgi:hypothetical protein
LDEADMQVTDWQVSPGWKKHVALRKNTRTGNRSKWRGCTAPNL